MKILVLILMVSLSLSAHGADGWGTGFVTFDRGSFVMGSPQEEKDRGFDENKISVTLTRPFAIMMTEVTQSQWYEVMEGNPSRFSEDKHCTNHRTMGDGVGMCPDHPVEGVSWNDVQEFLKKINEREGNTGCDGTPQSEAGCYRLPTEAEWEYASGGATMYKYREAFDIHAWYTEQEYAAEGPVLYKHKQVLDVHAWYKENAKGRTHRVGTKRLYNGLHDMYGNVWEWVADMYVVTRPGGFNPFVTKSTSTTKYRVVRGGDYDSHGKGLRPANRGNDSLGFRYSTVGFRPVKNL